MESYKVFLNRGLYIIRIGDKSPLIVKPEGAIEVIVLRVLSY